MNTKLCKPVLVPASDKNDIYNLLLRPNGKVMKCFTGAEYRRMVLIGWVPMELDLISLDPDEKIEEGDNFVNDYGEIITATKPILNQLYSPKKKVISTQSQPSLEYISKFVEEYNNGCVKDLEIEITNPTYDDWMENGASPVFPKPKLTNNYITIVEREPIVAIHLNHDPFWDNPVRPKIEHYIRKADMPVVYSEEEVYSMLQKLSVEHLLYGLPNFNMIGWDKLQEWFNQNKKK